jgi:hypothetical protein
MNKVLAAIIDYKKHPCDNKGFRAQCKQQLDANGALVLNGFLLPNAIQTLTKEANANEHLAYYCENSHNVYLKPQDDSLPIDHPRNQTVNSSKGCITDDQVPIESPLKVLYNAKGFQDFLCAVLGEDVLYKYDDNLSSINIHYAHEGQELGWHFDNSSFAITLLIQKPEAGGGFEYIRDFRNAEASEMNYDGVTELLNDKHTPSVLSIEAGDLVLFRGRNSVHRVTPTVGRKVRILSVLAYNSKPKVQLSESARMTFYGKLG